MIVSRLAVLAVLITGQLAAAAETGGGTFVAEPGLDARGLGLHCDTTTDDTTRLRTLIEHGGAACGKVLWLPAGCVVLLGSVGNDPIDVCAGTTIRGAGGTAGFALARQRCVSGDLPGAACTADAHCPGDGRCGFDGDATSSFAPDPARTYTLFRAQSGSGQRFIDFGIWVNQGQGAPRVTGGDGREVGVCAGGDRDGASCFQTCDAASVAPFAGLPCNASGPADCGGAAGSCQNREQCSAAGGLCRSVAFSVPRGGSGPGKIHPLDLAGSFSAEIRGIAIFDHRRGDFHVRSGNESVVTDLDTEAGALTVPVNVLGPSYATNQSVDVGFVASSRTRATRISTAGWRAGIQAWMGVTIADAIVGGYGDSTVPGWPGSTGLLVSSYGASVTQLRCANVALVCKGTPGCASALLYGVLPELGTGLNFMVSDLVCDGTVGPKIVLQGAGNQYQGLRAAWGSRGAVIAVGDLRGKCAGGARAGMVCVTGGGADELMGCPNGACAPSDAFPAGSVNHAIVAGALLQSAESPDVAWVRTPDGLRCEGGSEPGTPCTTDADCSGTGAHCRVLTFANVSIVGNEFYGGTGATAVELNTTAVGVHPVGGPSLQNWIVDANYYQGFATGFEFPLDEPRCVGGRSAGARCAADADCAGGGSCASPVRAFHAGGNMADVVAPLVNWSWNYGDTSTLQGLRVSDDQGTVVAFDAAEALLRGMLVSPSPHAANAVIKTIAAAPEKTLGVALNTIQAGGQAKVLISGKAVCVADGPISPGDALTPSATAPGRVVAATSRNDVVVGKALAAGAKGDTFGCAI